MSVPAGDDRLLVERMLAGREEAFEQFFHGYFPRLYRFALARLRDETAAEEVVQASLCRAMDKLGSFRGEAALFTWLCTFCRHEIWAYLKTREREEAMLVEDGPEVRPALESLSAALAGDPEQLASQSELRRLVQVVLDVLPTHYGDSLEWKYIEGLSVQEIAERLGLGLKATESLLVRARRAFRDGYAAVLERGVSHARR